MGAGKDPVPSTDLRLLPFGAPEFEKHTHPQTPDDPRQVEGAGCPLMGRLHGVGVRLRLGFRSLWPPTASARAQLGRENKVCNGTDQHPSTSRRGFFGSSLPGRCQVASQALTSKVSSHTWIELGT